MAEENEPQRSEAKIIAFSGPKEGAGKTTLVLNLALGWAGIQKRPVLIVPLDPLARQEHSFYLDIKKPVSVSDILRTLGNTSIAVVVHLRHSTLPWWFAGSGWRFANCA